jgi:hypothetical protein
VEDEEEDIHNSERSAEFLFSKFDIQAERQCFYAGWCYRAFLTGAFSFLLLDFPYSSSLRIFPSVSRRPPFVNILFCFPLIYSQANQAQQGRGEGERKPETLTSLTRQEERVSRTVFSSSYSLIVLLFRSSVCCQTFPAQDRVGLTAGFFCTFV